MEMNPENLQSIPGIGKTISNNLARINITRTSDFKNKEPDELFDMWCEQATKPSDLDRCVLYIFRLAVYWANGGREPQKLKWNLWSDERNKIRVSAGVESWW